MRIKLIEKQVNIKEKKVFLRVDFNVPCKSGRIQDDYKIVAGLETIKFLLDKKAKIIIATHLGSPTSKNDINLSTKPLASRLKKVLNYKIRFIPELNDAGIASINNMKPGEIVFLENLRFHPGELSNDKEFAKKLASLADVYVNDAFAVSHRAQASVSDIKNYLPSYAGILLAKEVLALNKVLKPKKPLVTVMGGAKISTKAPLIKNLLKSSKYILLGGGLANNFLKFNGVEIGNSLFDQDSNKLIKKIVKESSNNKKIIVPVDVIVQTSTGTVLAKKISNLKKNDTIFDIGPETVSIYAKHIKQAQTLIWNGPMGKSEEDKFKNGTLAIARLIASQSSGKAYGVVGGGETVAALKISGMMEYVDWVSTAGGAMLSYLGKEKMPGLKKIIY